MKLYEKDLGAPSRAIIEQLERLRQVERDLLKGKPPGLASLTRKTSQGR